MKFARRGFLKSGISMGIGLTINPIKGIPSISNLKLKDTIKIGMVGVGSRGFYLMSELIKLEGVEIPAVCDIKKDKIEKAQKHIVDAGYKKPDGYSRGHTDFLRLCDRKDLDLVITATPWEWHTPVCVAAMKAGKHAATEVPACITVEECWKLVEISEQTGKFCTMLENVSYWHNVMTISKMIHQGIFGDILHAEVGYQHDIRPGRFNEVTLKEFNETGLPHWRIRHHENGEGNLYPTHPLGPVAQWMDINRGDRFLYLVSMSTPSKGLNIYASRVFGEDHPLAKKHYAHGDINTTLIKTEKGRTITLYQDCATYRPYHLNLRVQGTEGIYTDDLGIYINGLSPEKEKWDDFDKAEYIKIYEPELWREQASNARGGGHGGGDYLVLFRLIDALRQNRTPDIDVYDAVTWSAVTELSGRSVKEGSEPVEFPDFTRGKWKVGKPDSSIFIK